LDFTQKIQKKSALLVLRNFAWNGPFASVPDLSTQGNSRGQVNNPKVVSDGTFICGVCNKRFATQEEVTNHKRDAHDQVNYQCEVCRKDLVNNGEMQKHMSEDHYQDQLEKEMDVLEDAAKEEDDLFAAMELITKTAIEPDMEKETRDQMMDKLTRYKSIMTQKNKIIRLDQEKVKMLQLSMIFA
jgi:hypothetical protein